MPTADAGAIGDEYPRAQVTRLEQRTRRDGSDATLSLLLEHEGGTTSQVEVEMAVTDYAWGSQWQAVSTPTPKWFLAKRDTGGEFR